MNKHIANIYVNHAYMHYNAASQSVKPTMDMDMDMDMDINNNNNNMLDSTS